MSNHSKHHTTVFFAPGYNTERIRLETVNKAVHIAASLRHRLISGVIIKVPEALTEDEVAAVHDRDYITAVRDGEPSGLAGSGIGRWHPDIFKCVTLSNGGVVAAVLEAMHTGRNAGSLSSGLHHARAGSGAGFCTFNGLAIAARRAVQEGATRVLIIDFDAHFGGGTASIIDGDPAIEQIDVSVANYDSYRGVPNARATLAEHGRYLETIEEFLAAVADPGSIDVVIYNAGMDPHQFCSTGGRKDITTEVLAAREEMVFSWARTHGLPVAWVLAGGYMSERLDMDGIVDLHRLTIEASARHSA
ncbi:MAG: hypothetical protein ACKOYG_11015 [Ilumatobacteraceae bacterium]